MATKISSLYAEISADTSKLEAGLKSTSDGLTTTRGKFTDLAQIVTGIKSAFDLAGEAINAVGKIYDQTVGKAIALADETEALSRLTGASAEDSSRLIDTTKKLGVSYETLSNTLEYRVRKNMDASIETIGDLADQYNALPPGLERANFLMVQFGRSGSDVAELMEQGSAKIKDYYSEVDTGLIITQAQIDETKKLTIAQQELNDKWAGITTSIGMKAVPWLSELASEFQDQIDAVTKYQEVLGDKGLGAAYVYTFTHLGVLLGLEESHTDAVKQGTTNLALNYEAMGKQILSQQQSAEAMTSWSATSNIMQNAADMNTIAVAKQQNAVDTLLAQQDLLNVSTQTYSALLLYQQAQKVLDPAAALALGVALGVVDQSTVTAYSSMQTLNDKYLAGIIDADTYAVSVLALDDAIDNLHDKTVTIDYRTVYTDTHTSTTTTTPGPNIPGVPQGANGLNFIVPQGYPNDSYPMRVQSGEHVQVTPAGQSSGGSQYILNIYTNAATEPIIQDFYQLKSMATPGV